MDKLVFIKRIEKPSDKNGKPYFRLTDHENCEWNIFKFQMDFQVNKAYLFTYEKNEKGYPDITKITPVVNIFIEKALKDTANINDIKRDIGIATSYSVQLCTSGKISLEDLFTWSDKIYDYAQKKAESLMPQGNK